MRKGLAENRQGSTNWQDLPHADLLSTDSSESHRLTRLFHHAMLNTPKHEYFHLVSTYFVYYVFQLYHCLGAGSQIVIPSRSVLLHCRFELQASSSISHLTYQYKHGSYDHKLREEWISIR